MLTFQFTGVSGKMTVEEQLTAGMVGKQVQFDFSEDWDGLRKVAVFEAGDISCTTVDVQETDTIPAEALSVSLRRLYVGVYGISEDGEVVIPTVYATGPFIHIGTSSSGEGSDYAPEDPFWLAMEKEVAETLRFAPQTLTEEQKQQSRENIGASEEKPEAAELLMTILKNGVYVTEQYENILRLSAVLCGTVICKVSCVLDNVTADNGITLLAENDAYQAVLTANEGYALETVTVTMGGEDITAEAYSDGVVSIAAVTADVVINAAAAEIPTVAVEQVRKGSVSYVAGKGLQINATSAWRAMMLPVGQYLENGKTYRFSLGSISSTYRYGVQIMAADSPELAFAYVEETNVYYNTVSSRLVDTGWMSADYEYTAAAENLIVAVNFKRADETVVEADDYAVLLENFVMEVA